MEDPAVVEGGGGIEIVRQRGVESLIASPAKMTLGALSEEERRRRKCNDNLVRISVGLENASDLEADLQNALEEC